VCNSGSYDPDALDCILQSSWILDSGSILHISHQLYRFYNFAKAPKGDCVTTGGGDIAILGYNNVWVTITYRQTQQRALLKRMAYCQGFISNLISWNFLKKNGWRWNTKANVLWRVDRKIAERVNFCSLLVTAD
jgi:hypothetical protein